LAPALTNLSDRGGTTPRGLVGLGSQAQVGKTGRENGTRLVVFEPRPLFPPVPFFRPLDDLGVRSAMASLYQFDESHGKQHYLAIGERWKPYATIGSWYCWRYLDLNRAVKKPSKAAKG
jgi:hypothetical protein